MVYNEGIDPDQRADATRLVREREAEEMDRVVEEVKEERRRVEVRGAGGVAMDRRANAELVRRAFIVGYFWTRSAPKLAVSVWLERGAIRRNGLQPRE